MDAISSAAAGGFLAGVAIEFMKSIVSGVAPLLTKNTDVKILDSVFKEFKESFLNEEIDEKILRKIFKEYFKEQNVIDEFKKIFRGKSDEIDFDILEKCFFEKCASNGKEKIPDFNVIAGIEEIIFNIENLADENEEFYKHFNKENLAAVKESLEKRGTIKNHSLAKKRYLEHLIEYHNNLRFTGIPDLKEKHEISLPSVFVMQRVTEEIEEFDVVTGKKYINDDVGFGAREDYKLDDPSKYSYTEEKIYKGKKRSEPVKFEKTFNDSAQNNLVVLGDPGTGKSSLLKFLLLKNASEILHGNNSKEKNLFPIFIEIRKFENAYKRKEPGYKILDYLYDCVNDTYQISLPRGFFEKYLQGGDALILFDGLDEVAAENRRAEIRDKIVMFSKSVSRKNSVIITSRIPGYNKTSFSTENYRHFYLEYFNEDEIKEFVSKWYKTREKLETEAERKTEDLLKTIKDRPQIKELAKNPLLLTIIGIIHRYEAQLPQDRLTLYDKATEALLQTWDNIKEIIDQKFRLDEKRRFLEKLAIHLQSLEKGDESTVVIDKHDLYKILLPEFEKLFNCDKRKARAEVDNFLNVIRTRAGLLNEIGQYQWGFVHKTFQEYFAAKYIANEAILNFDPDIVTKYIDEYLSNPFWQETLLLTLRAIPSKQSLKILEMICNKDKTDEYKYLYHNHYFVIKFIAEQGTWLNNRNFTKSIIKDFLRWSIKNRDLCFDWNVVVWERFLGVVKLFTDKTSINTLNTELLTIAEDKNQETDLRRDCALAIGNLGYKDEAVINRLLTIAEDKNQETDLRRYCALAIGNLGYKDEAVNILLTIAEDKNQETDLRRYCAEAIGKLGYKDEAVNILLTIAEDKNQVAYLRRYCAEAIGKLGYKDEAVNILLTIAEDKNQETYLRRYCAEAIGNLGCKDKAVEILFELYLSFGDKTVYEAKWIYDSLWELTAVG
ncbi:MAG: HEAT repeat domain-containing protein [Ignavibacteria bacterium]|jgi:Holliday junction resolvasome RuvABC DNA-binding subunit